MNITMAKIFIKILSIWDIIIIFYIVIVFIVAMNTIYSI